MNGLAIKIISASAGSGKTYKLTGELLDHIKSGIEPENILATTFTNKAASELIERVRTELFKAGHRESAQRVLDGYLGTVNSVCGRLLKEFALECGLPPVQDVLPETEAHFIFERAVASVIEKYSPQIEPIARRFSMKERDIEAKPSASINRYSSGGQDWRKSIQDIISEARQNDIDANNLKKSASLSWKGLKELLGLQIRNRTASQLDDELTEAIRQAYVAIKDNQDIFQKTETVRNKLAGYCRLNVRAESLSWHDWVELSSKLEPAQPSQGSYKQVQDAANCHLEHPRFHEDLETFINLLFECAAEAMNYFADFKGKHGLIDFVDQEKLTLESLRQPHLRLWLRQKLDLVLVDEFQDTSPIQLALFLELADLGKKSIWVGDQKQSIYAFRGTDPVLMDNAIEQLTGNTPLDILSDSWRSRCSLLKFTNSLFSKTFESLKIPSNRVVLNHKIDDLPSQGIPLHVWRLIRKNSTEEAQSLATAMNQLISTAANYPVIEKESQNQRHLRPCDIAILCRTQETRKRVAEALEATGVRVTTPRQGLLSTPECVLGFACLRYLVDDKDTLALAEILHYTESSQGTPSWFQEWLTLSSSQNTPSLPVIKKLNELRDSLINLTPNEAMEAALNLVSMHESALKWGDGIHRLANVEKLRCLAREYEDQCLVNRSAATPAGLVTFLFNKIKGGDMDTQPEGQDEQAVQVLTYHGAKGLEWPMVIMFELDKVYEAKPFGTHVSSDQNNFDAAAPLNGRWIRYWPWAYGDYKTVEGLDSKIENSPEFKEAQDKQLKEAVRLLYVGMTRARDYLFFAVGVKPDKDNKGNGKVLAKWLDLLKGKDGKKILSLPQGVGKQRLSIGTDSFDIMVEQFDPIQPQLNAQAEQTFVTHTTFDDIKFPPARLVPSQVGGAMTPTVCITNTVRLGDRIPILGKVDMEILGNAIHAFLAVDNHSWDDGRRLAMAGQILDNWKVTAIKQENLLKVSNRLRSHIEQTYGAYCVWLREWPIHLKKGDQKTKGWIDLLLKTPSGGLVIIDHKSFPGSKEKREEKALSHAPQLAIYREAVEKATEKSVIATIIHMPVVGEMMELRI
jgi:ATP-dependent exoDNAse (exonuclease V) beta subunit